MTLDNDKTALEKAHVPYLGYIYMALSIPWVRILLITIPALLIGVLTVVSVWRDAGREAKAEREALSDRAGRRGRAARRAGRRTAVRRLRGAIVVARGAGRARRARRRRRRLAFFTATKTTPQPISVAPYSSLPTDTSIVPSWRINDVSGGGARPSTRRPSLMPCSSKTSKAVANFAANRYVDVDFSDFAPTGQTADSVVARGRLRRRQRRRQDELHVHGGCAARRPAPSVGDLRQPGLRRSAASHSTPRSTITQQLGVTSTDVANDLRLRIYFRSDGGNEMRLYRAVIKVVLLGKTWTCCRRGRTMRVDTDARPASVPWGLARVDTTAYRNAEQLRATPTTPGSTSR